METLNKMLEEYLKNKAKVKDYKALILAFPNVARNKNYQQKINSLIKKASELDAFLKADKIELIMKKTRIDFKEFKVTTEKIKQLEIAVKIAQVFEANQKPNFPSNKGAFILSIQTFPILTFNSQYGNFGLGVVFKDELFCVYSLTQKKNNAGEFITILNEFKKPFTSLKDAMIYVKENTVNVERISLIEHILS